MEPRKASGVLPFVQFVRLEKSSRPRSKVRKVKAMVRKFVFATMMGGLLLGATACNTVRGAGDDLKSAANTTEEAIN
jgi:entericidin B